MQEVSGCGSLLYVLGARLGAVLWGRAPILDPCHRCANLVCSQNVFDSRVAAFNRNCQLGAGRALDELRLMSRECMHLAWRWSIGRVLSPRLLLHCTVLALYKNVDLLVAYLGSSVELARDRRGCSEHPITMFYDVVSSVLREC